MAKPLQLSNGLPVGTLTNLTSGVTGVLPIANGGSNNGSLAVTAGGVIYTDGSKLVNVGAGTSGQLLKSNGASAPTWVTPSGASVLTTQVTTNAAISAASGAAFIFPLTTYDTTGGAYNNATGVYTAPNTGYYDIVGTGLFTNAVQTDMYLQLNSTIIQGRLLVSTGFSGGSLCTQVQCTAGDTLTFISDVTAGGLAYSALTNTPSGYVPVLTYTFRG